MAMLANGTIVGDGSWVLRIHVTDINVDREFRVKGDMHIGGVMLRLVDDLGKFLLFHQNTRCDRETRSSPNDFHPFSRLYLLFFLKTKT